MTFSKSEPMSESPIIRKALISVSNKTGLIPFAQQLTAGGIEILATGGTAELLRQQNIPLTTITDYTGFPEIMGGRVKTLHPKIYAGLLRRPGVDEALLQSHQIEPIDLVIVNLYPFQETVAREGCSFEQGIEQIDVGGPSMLRAAAKNHLAVTVIVDPQDYEEVWKEIQKQGHTHLETRRRLAQKVFAHTALYDHAISDYFKKNAATPHIQPAFPNHFRPEYHKQIDLRYGENPHQSAALYVETPAAAQTLATAELVQGKPLSFNNFLDSDAALNCVRALDPSQPGCAIIKHATPCGVAQAASLEQAYQQALMADPTSAFGGIIAFNQPIDAATAQAILNQSLVEVILTPKISAEVLSLFKSKPYWRILACGSPPRPAHKPLLRSISGGLLVQQEDTDNIEAQTLPAVTQRQPTAEEWQDLIFAWKVVQFVKSNAIVVAKDQATLGIGGGQTSRVFSAEIAVLKAQRLALPLSGAVAASDAFFPFADGLKVLAEAGIRAIIQPGGSKRDAEVIAAADNDGIAMVFTGVRHFRH
jgi:phosphoribosylaminoimidazolecarboxamide formyltransferase / IMP cyclohydrolase